MSTFCILIPNAPNTNKPSNLFKRLQQEFGRDNAISIWKKLSTDEFYTNYANKNPLTIFDENGEITFESAIEYINLDNVTDINKKIQIAETELNTNLPYSNVDIVQRAVEFNKSNPLLVATVVDLPVSGVDRISTMSIKVSARTETSAVDIENLQKAYDVYNSIDNFLNKLGINIHILDANRFNGENALLMPGQLYEDSNSIFGVVNIANNMSGFLSLPEEFGHFLIECVKDNPIIQRSLKYLTNNDGLIESILGDEYQDIVDYYTNKGRADLVAAEALGRLVIQDINDGRIMNLQPTQQSWLKSKVTNIVANVKNAFKLRNVDQINALQTIREAVVPVLNTINEHNEAINSILSRFKQYGDTLAHTETKLNSAQSELTNNYDIIQQARDRITQETVKYKSIYQHVKSMEGILQNLDNMAYQLSDIPKTFDTNIGGLQPLSGDIEGEAVLQIGKFMQLNMSIADDRLKVMERIQTEAVDGDYKVLLENAQELRAIQDFVHLNTNCVPIISDLLRTLKSLPGESNAAFRTYADKLEEILKEFNYTVSKLEDEYLHAGTQIMHSLFLPLFSEDGSETIERKGFWRPSTQSTLALGDILEYSLGDISAMSRFINAYYDMGDPYLNMVYYFIRRKQEQVRRNCIDAQNELRQIYNDYVAETGSSDMSWAYERRDDGVPTGYFRNLQNIDFYKFNQIKKKMNEEYKEKYGEFSAEKRRAMADWMDDNTEDFQITTYRKNFSTGALELEEDPNKQLTIQIPKQDSRWASSGPELTSVQKKYLHRILEFKNKQDQLLPSHLITSSQCQYFNCVQRTAGGVVESVLTGKDGFMRELGNVLKDKVVFKENDQEFGEFNNEDNETSSDSITEGLFKKSKLQHKIQKIKKNLISKYSTLTTQHQKNQISYNDDLTADDIISNLHNSQNAIVSRPNDTNSDYYEIREEDGQVHKYLRLHKVMGSEYRENMEPENSNTYSLEAGNSYDILYRNYFNDGISIENLQKPYNMSDSAFKALKSYLPIIKQQMTKNGERFLANNIVLYYKFDSGRRVAGEVDILAVDKNGNVSIYDVKTTRGKMANWSKMNPKLKIRSTLDSYTLQLSGYKDLFELSVGAKVNKLALIGNEIVIDDNGVVTDHSTTRIKEVSYNPTISRAMDSHNPSRLIPIEQDSLNDVIPVQTTMDNDQYKRIPLYFVKKLSDMRRLSTDMFTSLSEYTEMAQTFNGRHEIADIIELSASIAEARKVKQVVNEHSLIEKLKSRIGDNQTVEYERLVLESAQNSNIVKAIKDLRDKHIYGQYSVTSQFASEGKLSLSKIAETMLRYVSFSMLGYNLFTGINNIIIGKYQRMIEAAAGEYFNFKDYGKAEVEVNSQLFGFVTDYLSSTKKNKLWLVNEMFNLDMDWKKVLEGQAYYKSGLLKSMDILSPSFLMDIGEKNLKLTTGVAILKGYKLKKVSVQDGSVEDTNLYDALTVETTTSKHGQSISRLVLAGGDSYKYLKENNDEFSLANGGVLSNNDVRDVTLMINIVNHRMDGVYNSEDMYGMKRYLWGKIFGMYRNYIVPPFQKRTKKPQYNFELKTFEEGYNRTLVRYLLGFLTYSISKDKTVNSSYKEIAFQQMTKTQQANMKRALTEWASIFSTFLLLNYGLGDWKEYDDWGTRALYYFMHRLYTEQTFYYNPISAWEILQSPTPAMSVIEKFAKIASATLDPKELQSGPFQGKSNVYAAFMRALPVYWGIHDFANLAEDDKRFLYMNN